MRWALEHERGRSRSVATPPSFAFTTSYAGRLGSDARARQVKQPLEGRAPPGRLAVARDQDRCGRLGRGGEGLQRVVRRTGKEGPAAVAKPMDAALLPLLLRPLILRVHRDGQPPVGGLVEDPRLGSKLAAPNRGAERARGRKVTALS